MKGILDWMMAPAVFALGCLWALRLAFDREWRVASAMEEGGEGAVTEPDRLWMERRNAARREP